MRLVGALLSLVLLGALAAGDTRAAVDAAAAPPAASAAAGPSSSLSGPAGSAVPSFRGQRRLPVDLGGDQGATYADNLLAELPGGGRVLFPGRRLVALYGHPGTPSMGVLGEQPLAEAVVRAKGMARTYRKLSTVPVVPTFELIATVAQRSAGADGDYSGEASVALLRPWVRAAGRNGMYVVLDVQPGRADVLDQVKRYRSLLLQPHVGIAVDPEWKLEPDQEPLEQIGGIGAGEINRTSQWLAELTRSNGLPQKLFVLHQFRLSMIRNEDRVGTDRPEVAVLVHMDGQGSPSEKHATWDAVKAARPAGLPLGWKNFYDEDTHLFTPAETMAKRPRPLMVSYQ